MTSREKFQIIGDSLTGHGLSFDVGRLVKQETGSDRLDAITDMANVIYMQGRDSARLPYDDRFDLHCAVDALRALAVVVGTGTPTSDRYRRCADIMQRLLQEQERQA